MPADIEHLVGLDLIRNYIKGRVLAVHVGRDTFVDVVLVNGAFESWYLPLCVEARLESAAPVVELLPSVDRLLYKGEPVDWFLDTIGWNVLRTAGMTGSDYVASAHDNGRWNAYRDPVGYYHLASDHASNLAEAKAAAIRALLDDGVLTVAPPKPTLVWIQGSSPGASMDTWHLGRNAGEWISAPYTSWFDGGCRAYGNYGAGVERTLMSSVGRVGCNVIAGWAREDGNDVPDHPIYGSL